MKSKATKGMRWPGHGMSWKEFLTSLKKEYSNDTLGDVAGNLVFAGMLALFPFFIFLVALGGLIITPENAKALLDQLGGVAPGPVTQIISERLNALQQGSHASIMTVSALVAFWAASGGVVALMKALNTVYGVKESRPFWKLRGTAFLMTLFTAVFALVAALAAVATPALANFIGGPLGTAILWLRIPVAATLMMFLWAVLFYFLPDVEQEFRFITPGSVMGVVIWALASWGFSVYVSNFGKYDATYGTLGGVIVMLLWMWISAQVLLIGAEINAIIEHKSPDGKRAGAKSMAAKGADDTKTEKVEKQLGGANWAGQWAARRMPERVLSGELGHPATRKPMSGFERFKLKLFAAGAALSFLASRKRRTA